MLAGVVARGSAQATAGDDGFYYDLVLCLPAMRSHLGFRASERLFPLALTKSGKKREFGAQPIFQTPSCHSV